MKIIVMGYSGSGKSTLARHLGKKYRIPVLHLDRVQWLAGWKARPQEKKQAMAARFMDTHDSWVIDGNYTDLEYERRILEADRIILLELNRFSCLYRVWRRYRKYKGRTRKDMGKGCTEKLDWEFAWWVFQKGRSRERKRKLQQIRQNNKEKTEVVKNQRQLSRYFCT
ncbi:MAG: topology modulation protein [Lachnospiraceae bacterium]|nr:topology modulation protein [Lachnospiraceae bacterium]MCI9185259.1 topology modulation protein [Lachnospiraceae bacterium]